MPLDVLGRTRTTLIKSASNIYSLLSVLFESGKSRFPGPRGLGNLLKLYRDGD